MGGQVSSLLFSKACENQCFHDNAVSLKDRMAKYGVGPTEALVRRCDDVMAWRVQLFNPSQSGSPTHDFLEAIYDTATVSLRDKIPACSVKLQKQTAMLARTMPWLAHQLHERFHPDAILVLPHEVSLLFLHGQCPYGTKTDTMCSVLSSFVSTALVVATGRLYEAHTRVLCFGCPTDETCQCAWGEAHNYVVHRSQQGSARARRWVARMDDKIIATPDNDSLEKHLNGLPDLARWGLVLCRGALVTLHSEWWRQEKPLRPIEPLFDPKPDFVHMDKPEIVTQSFLSDIVAMTEPGATVDLSGFASLHTSHVEKLCLEWMTCGRVPRKLLLKGTLVDGGLILSKPFLQFLVHPQVHQVDVRGTSFLECADNKLLPMLAQDGILDRLLFLDDSSPGERMPRLWALNLLK